MTAFETVQLVFRILLAIVFVGMGINHFRPGPARGMAAMIPEYFTRGGLISGKTLVRFTGVCEIAGGIGLLVPVTTFLAGIMLVVFLVAVFPANHLASEHPEKFGAAAIPFWPRYIAQLVLIAIILVSIVTVPR
ncbi:DoxX family membrane protein [Glaciihabitans sp. INWT7]|uniref:DoxX family protein n=1 Tax=Glaciihabitans sp. INWT7 TaxID=2596912 RepID=UPI00162532D2|nr:DoxX family membrane protein [Glaciihabitans sp. INWT7]QNE46099.1 DoxX family membrane protein [Glaciihabitans sp. INWT7]